MKTLIVNYTVTDAKTFNVLFDIKDMIVSGILEEDMQEYLSLLYPIFIVQIKSISE